MRIALTLFSVALTTYFLAAAPQQRNESGIFSCEHAISIWSLQSNRCVKPGQLFWSYLPILPPAPMDTNLKQ